MSRIIRFWKLLKRAAQEFVSDNAVKRSASLAYYTAFSMGPLLLVMMSLAGIFFGKEAVQGKVYGQIKGLVGDNAAMQIQEIGCGFVLLVSLLVSSLLDIISEELNRHFNEDLLFFFMQ